MLRNFLALFVVVGSWVALVSPAVHAQDQKPVRIVLVTGGGHDFKKFSTTLDALCEKTGGLKIVQRLEPGKDGPDAHIRKIADLKRDDADVILFYTVGYKLDAPQERALEQFVEAGGGLVAIHCASASFGSSQAWQRLIGCRFAGHYKGLHKLDISITDPKHPIMAGVEPFTIVDEEYNHVFAKVERKVLAEFKQRPEGSKAKDNDAVWTRELGKGRIFYTALGHGTEAWASPGWQKMVLQSIFWSAGQPRLVTVAEKK